MNGINVNQTIIRALVAMLAITNGYAEQPASAFTFRAVIPAGTNLGGHVFGPGTAIDGIALNDAMEVAFVAHWIEGGVERGGVFTSSGAVALDGDVIENKTLSHISASSLTINNASQVAFEAVYSDKTTAGTGVFVQRHFVLALATPGLSGDFVLTEDGHVVPKTGATATTLPAPAPTKGSAPGIRFRVPSRWVNVINNNSPIVIPPTISTSPSQPAPNPASSQQTLAAAQLARVVTCPVPAFPYPAEWEQLGAAVSGPIVSHAYDGPPTNKTYESQLIGKLPTAFRTIQFGSDCHPLVIAIGDNSSVVSSK